MHGEPCAYANNHCIKLRFDAHPADERNVQLTVLTPADNGRTHKEASACGQGNRIKIFDGLGSLHKINGVMDK